MWVHFWWKADAESKEERRLQPLRRCSRHPLQRQKGSPEAAILLIHSDISPSILFVGVWQFAVRVRGLPKEILLQALPRP